MSDFEKWFIGQDFYTNMRFVHGDALFDKDTDFYRVLAVQIAYEAWSTQRQRSKDEFISLTQEWHTKGWGARQDEIDQKDKKINKALNFINNWWHPDVDQKSFVEAVSKALRGDDDLNLSS